MQQASTVTGKLAEIGAGLQAAQHEQTLRMPYGTAP